MVTAFAYSSGVAQQRHTGRMLEGRARVVRVACGLDEVAFRVDLNAVGNVAGVLSLVGKLGKHSTHRAKVLLRVCVDDITI